MTANRGLFVRNNGTVGTTPAEGRLVLATLVAENAPGVPRQGLLEQVTTTVVTGTSSTSPMSYDIGPCQPVINRATNEGVYIMTLSGTTNVTTTAAPATGSRWDLIYVKQNDLDKGDANNLPVASVLQGTPAAGTPTKPYASLPAGAYVLAEAQVSAGATATNSAQVTITQVWNYTAFRGNPVTVRTSIERDGITSPQLGMRVLRLDDSRRIEEWSGTAWRYTAAPLGMVAHARLTSNSGQVTAQTIVTNIATFSFKAGRRYRLTFDSNFYTSDTASTFAFGISTCSTGDSASAITGLTQLASVSDRPTTALEGRHFRVVAHYFPATDTTLQIKGWAQRVVGSGYVIIQADATNANDLIVEDLGRAY